VRQGIVAVLEIRHLAAFEAGFGHAVADGIATEVGARLRRVAEGSRMVVARLDGGRFAALMPVPTSQAAAASWAQDLVAAVGQPVIQGNLSIDVGLRVGLAMAPAHGSDLAELLRAADGGVREAADQDRTVGWFDTDRDRATTRRLELASELRTAIEHEHLRLAFQPKVDLASGRVVGVEALCRWPHVERGFVSPVEFIDVAERTGLIRPLTEWVARTSADQFLAWQAQGLHLPIAVNLSNAALVDPDMGRLLVDVIESRGHPAGRRRPGDLQRGRHPPLRRRLRDRPLIPRAAEGAGRSGAEDRPVVRGRSGPRPHGSRAVCGDHRHGP
jgi:predicted signal transduction protein with EAL and GGDEF domain